MLYGVLSLYSKNLNCKMEKFKKQKLSAAEMKNVLGGATLTTNLIGRCQLDSDCLSGQECVKDAGGRNHCMGKDIMEL
jgi:hypothetical protein